MSKLCKDCGADLDEGVSFCTNCGANVSAVPKTAEASLAQAEASPTRAEAPLAQAEASPTQAEASLAQAEASPTQAEASLAQAASEHKKDLLKTGKTMAAAAKTKLAACVKNSFSHAAPACPSAGESAMPLTLSALSSGVGGEGLLSALKSGLSALTGGIKRTLGDKKRLGVVVALGAVWLLVNFLAALGIFPLPVRMLSWLTAARGSLLGGSIGKGLVAALLTQLIADHKGTLQSLTGGVDQLKAAFKSGKESHAPMLLGAGAALIACNLMVSSSLQNTMVCIAGFALSAKALTQNGYLRRILEALPLKQREQQSKMTSFLMYGWTLGFALFAALCVLPGGRNGTSVGLFLLIAGGVLTALNKSKQEVAPK